MIEIKTKAIPFITLVRLYFSVLCVSPVVVDRILCDVSLTMPSPRRSQKSSGPPSTGACQEKVGPCGHGTFGGP